MKKLIVFAALLVALYSCDEAPPSHAQTSVSGVVYEGGVAEKIPISNALVEFVWIDRRVLNTIYHHLDSARTDEEGRFKVSALAPNEPLYVHVVDSDGYFNNLIYEQPRKNVEFGEADSRDLHILPNSWVKIQYDQLDPNHGLGVNELPGSKRLNSYALSSDTTILERALGNSSLSLNLFYFDSGNQLSHESRTINTGSHDTLSISISH